MNQTYSIRPTNSNDTQLIKDLMAKHWGGEPLVIRGKNYYPSTLDGMLILKGNKVTGFLIYEIQDKMCEIVVFEIFEKFQGIGTKALNELKQIAKNKGCNKLHLMTTNDNLDALRFYQKRGFTICGIHLNSMELARKMKPAIPEIGDYGIPLRDEIDLELVFQD